MRRITRVFAYASIAALVVLVSGRAAGQAMSPMREVGSSFGDLKTRASVAYDPEHGLFLVAWQVEPSPPRPGMEKTFIQGRLLDHCGSDHTPWSTVMEIAPKDDQWDRQQPAVAYDPVHQRYLLVYSANPGGTGSNWDVYGRFFSWDLNPFGFEPEFPIAENAGSEDDPAVALSTTSGRFLVTWSDSSAGSNLAVRGASVSSGAMTVVTSATLADHPSAHRYPADVAWEPWYNRFLIVYDDRSDVYARTVQPTDLATGSEITVAAWPDQEINPKVATCGEAGFLIAWESLKDLTHWDVTLRFVKADGSMDPIDYYAPFGISQSPVHEMDAALSCDRDGREYLVVWEQQVVDLAGPFGLAGGRVSTAKVIAPLASIRPATSDEVGVTFNPAVAGSSPGWIVAWDQRDPIHGDSDYDLMARSVYRLYADGFEDGLSTWSAATP
jgi:hypothetical protein